VGMEYATRGKRCCDGWMRADCASSRILADPVRMAPPLGKATRRSTPAGDEVHSDHDDHDHAQPWAAPSPASAMPKNGALGKRGEYKLHTAV
jgi:hypothetical protein